MGKKLIVKVRCLRDSGWVLPRHRLAFGKPFEGIFSLQEQHVPSLNRHSRVATLVQADGIAQVPGIATLYDATLLRATADEWVVTGFERLEQAAKVMDVVQTWLITLAHFNETPV